MTVATAVQHLEPTTLDRVTDTEERAMVDTARRIAADVPYVTEAEVMEVLAEYLDATRGAKVQNFRLLLAERSARARLSCGVIVDLGPDAFDNERVQGEQGGARTS